MARLNRAIRKQFMITEELNAKLKYIASSRSESQNEIVNKALSAYLKRWNYEEIQRNDGAGAQECSESN
jgi:predicted transcriptional regulator